MGGKAKDEMRKMLDALMGSNRNGDAPPTQKHFSDSDVCKFYLVGLCPHDLFNNTRNDLGPCPQVHNEGLKIEFEEARAKGYKDSGFDYELERELERVVGDCDKRIVKAQKRLEETQGQDSSETEAATLEIKGLITQAEILGEEGKVEESMQLLQRAEELKQRTISQQASQLLASISTGAGETNLVVNNQKLRVCDVCASYLSIFDSDRRLADHFGGKMHIGYLQCREKLKELRDARIKNRHENRDREKGGEKDRERERERERDRGEKGGDRERERDRFRDDRGRSNRYEPYHRDSRRESRGDRGDREREREREKLRERDDA